MTIEKATKLPDTPRVRRVPTTVSLGLDDDGEERWAVEFREITEPSEYEAYKTETEEAIKKIKAFTVSKIKYQVTKDNKLKSPNEEDLEYFEEEVFPYEPILDYEKSKLGGQSIGDTYYEYKKDIEYYSGQIEIVESADDKKTLTPKKELKALISENVKELKRVNALYNKFLKNHFDNIKKETIALLEESISDENLQVLEQKPDKETEEVELEPTTKVFEILFPNESESFYSEFMEALKKLKNYGEYGNLLLMLNKTASLEITRTSFDDDAKPDILTDPKTRKRVIEPILSSLDKLKKQVNDTYFDKKKRFKNNADKLNQVEETYDEDFNSVVKLSSYFKSLRDEMDNTKSGKKKNSIRESTMKHHRDLLSRLNRYLKKVETNKPADIYKVLTAGNAKTKGDVLKVVSFLKYIHDNPYKIGAYDYSPKDGLINFQSRTKKKLLDDSEQKTYTPLFNNYDKLIDLGEDIQNILQTELEGWFYDEEKTIMYGKVITEHTGEISEEIETAHDSLTDNPVNEEKVKLLDIILRDVKVQGEIILLGKKEAQKIRQSMLNIEEILQRQFRERNQKESEQE